MVGQGGKEHLEDVLVALQPPKLKHTGAEKD
jgi:hypothetical protein